MNKLLKFPNGFVICASALLCAAVVALQNAELYAGKMEAPLYRLSQELLSLPELLRSAGRASGASQLNTAEKTGISRVSAAISPETQPEEEDTVQEEMLTEAALPSAEPAAEPEVPVVMEADAAAEPAAEPLPVEDSPAAEPELIPAPESRWWPLLAQRTLSPAASSYFREAQEPFIRFAAPAKAPAEPVRSEESPAQPAPESPSAPESPTPEVEPSAPIPAAAAEPLPAPAPEQQVAQLTQAPPMRCRIMMVGDSLMEDLGPKTHKAMKLRKGLEFVVSAKFSTGLCRPDFFNWPAHMRGVVSKRPPDLVIFFIGANDGMSIKDGKRLVPTGGQEWRDAYGRKMDELVSIARDAGADVIWVELPAIGGRYNKVLHENQIAQRTYCENNGITYLQTDPLLSGEWGRFEAFGTYKGRQVRLRTKDVTHLTYEGNMKVLDALLPIIERKLIDFYLAHPERHLTDEQVAKIKNVPAVYTCRYTSTKGKEKSVEQPAPAPVNAQ